jgi:uncharacterized protein with HEPN domain
MSKRPALILIEDIYEAIEKIERYVDTLELDLFIEDEKTSDAVVRNLEIIGEAASRLPKDFTEQHTNIDWPKIIGLRHRIVHDYFGVDLNIIWQIVHNELPIFKKALHEMYKKPSSS